MISKYLKGNVIPKMISSFMPVNKPYILRTKAKTLQIRRATIVGQVRRQNGGNRFHKSISIIDRGFGTVHQNV